MELGQNVAMEATPKLVKAQGPKLIKDGFEKWGHLTLDSQDDYNGE